ncbi:MAG: flavodoxin family protein [Chloroflexi bacterium]|nr:flavodoxin family protein [Chloroflexota bacterium]
MKALCIIGSPREKGNTAFIVDRVIAGMEEKRVDVKRYGLGALNINYCKGCHSCEETRRCIQRDDMDLVIQDLFEADIVLVASPSYWGDVTGQLKVFIDRCTPLCNAKTGETFVPPGKVGAAVAIRAGKSVLENQHIIDAIEHFFGHLGIDLVEAYTLEGVDQLTDLEGKNIKIHEAYELGLRISEHVQL